MESNWIDVLLKITKQNNNRFRSSIKLTPKQASSKKNEGFVYQNLLYQRKKLNSKHEIGDLVRTTDLKRTFFKSEKIKWSYELYKFNEIINDTIPSYRNDILTERYNEAPLKTTKSALDENNNVMERIMSLRSNQNVFAHHYSR